MDVSLSDLLVCPRCGPTYGLILLPDDATDRRVRSGVLGCANCRERYPIEEGVADLRPERGTERAGQERAVPGATTPGEPERAVRLAGLMDLAEARGTVLVVGPAAVHAGVLSELVEGVEVVADADPSGGTVSAIRVGPVLPFRTGGLRGVALTGPRTALLEEGARVLGREGNLVVDPAPSRARERLEAAGLRILAEEGGVVVATRRS